MSLSLDLNIGEEILEHLKIEDAIREIISNAFDEHTMNNIDKQIEIFKKNKEWIIRDFGTGIRDRR
jgi:anti-sigma regulatory factor (Ser/Thr protein kinase)